MLPYAVGKLKAFLSNAELREISAAKQLSLSNPDFLPHLLTERITLWFGNVYG